MSSWKGFVSFQVVLSNPLKDGQSLPLTWEGSCFSGTLIVFQESFGGRGSSSFLLLCAILSEESLRHGSSIKFFFFMTTSSLFRVAKNVKKGEVLRVEGFSFILLAVGRGFRSGGAA